MKTKSLFLYLPLLLALMLWGLGCDNQDNTSEKEQPDKTLQEGSIDESSFNSYFLNAEIEYVKLDNLPSWLISWITDVEEKCGRPNTLFRKVAGAEGELNQLYRGKWEDVVYYYIYNGTNSCVFCDSFYEDGSRLDLSDEKVSQAFMNAIPHMKRIIIE